MSPRPCRRLGTVTKMAPAWCNSLKSGQSRRSHDPRSYMAPCRQEHIEGHADRAAWPSEMWIKSPECCPACRCSVDASCRPPPWWCRSALTESPISGSMVDERRALDIGQVEPQFGSTVVRLRRDGMSRRGPTRAPDARRAFRWHRPRPSGDTGCGSPVVMIERGRSTPLSSQAFHGRSLGEGHRSCCSVRKASGPDDRRHTGRIRVKVVHGRKSTSARIGQDSTDDARILGRRSGRTASKCHASREASGGS